MEVAYFNVSIRDFIDDLDKPSQIRIARIFDLVQKHENNVEFSHSKALGQGLYEFRTRGGIDVRLLYTFYRNQALILHAFVKKTMRIHASDLFLAKSRLRQLDKS